MSSLKLSSEVHSWGEYFGFDVLIGLEVILQVPASSFFLLDSIPSSKVITLIEIKRQRWSVGREETSPRL